MTERTPPSPGRAFAWPAVVSVVVGGAFSVLAGVFAFPILALGLALSGVAAWARLPAGQSIPRLMVLLFVAVVIEVVIFFSLFPWQ